MATTSRQETRAARPPVGDEGAGRLLRFTLWVGLVDTVGFGALILLAPAFVVETLGGSPAFAYFSLRWSGGVLLGLGLGAYSMLRDPRHQLPMFTAFATGTLLAGLGKVWSGIAGEYSGATWWYYATLVGTLGVSILMWITRYRAKELLSGTGGGL